MAPLPSDNEVERPQRRSAFTNTISDEPNMEVTL